MRVSGVYELKGFHLWRTERCRLLRNTLRMTFPSLRRLSCTMDYARVEEGVATADLPKCRN